MAIAADERFSDTENALRAIFAQGIVGVWTGLPGYIVSFDPDKVTAVVQIGVMGQRQHPDNSVEFLQMPVLNDVPVMFPRGGGATLTFPVKANDECFVLFACRSIDAWWQSGGIQPPSDSRTHDLSDAFVFVGPMSQKNKIAGISTSVVQLRSDDGETSISLDPAGKVIEVKAPNGTTFIGPVHFNDAVTGDSTAAFDGDVTGDGTSLHTHTHSGVQSGSDDSGPPV